MLFGYSFTIAVFSDVYKMVEVYLPQDRENKAYFTYILMHKSIYDNEQAFFQGPCNVNYKIPNRSCENINIQIMQRIQANKFSLHGIKTVILV